MHVDFFATQSVARNAQFLGVCLGVGQRGSCRLFHNVTELAGKQEVVSAIHYRHLNEHDVAACRRVEHSCCSPNHVVLGGALGMNLRPTYKIRDVSIGQHHFFDIPGGDTARHFPERLADFTFQLSHSSLACVSGDQLTDGVVFDDDFF